MTHTPTGFKLAKKYDSTSLLKPFDTIPTMIYLFYSLRLKILIISERDVWPIFILTALCFNCKIYFVNYELKQTLFKNWIHKQLAEKIYLKNKSLEKQNSNKYKYLGDIKILNENAVLNNRKGYFPTLIIASANENEVDIHLNLIKNLLDHNLLLNIFYVPRHLNWESKLRKKLSQFKIVNYDWITDGNNFDLEKSNTINYFKIFWEMGILNKLYEQSHVCLMGDTFNKVGGHNLAEPANKNNVIVVGPNVKTCEFLAKNLPFVYSVNEKDLFQKIVNIFTNNNFKNNALENKMYLNKLYLQISNNLNQCIEDILN